MSKRIIYLCDRKACKKCGSVCAHTDKIDHARNFEKVAENVYFEKEQPEGTILKSRSARLKKRRFLGRV